MKIIKYLLFLFLILIIAGSIYVATKEGDYQVEHTEFIQAPREVVFDEVKDYENWENWVYWTKEPDNVVINYGERHSGEGASYSWKSESRKDGEIRTLEVKPFSSINQEISFEKSFTKVTGDVYWRFEEQENGTEVTWGMQGQQSFMEKLAFSFQEESISEMMRPKFRKSLEDLEVIVLNKMETYSINVDGVTQHGGGYYMYTTTASRISQVDDRMQKMIDEVSNYMDKNNIEQIGNPFVLYNDWNEENNSAIFSAGIFTPSQIITPAESDILNGRIPEQKVVKTTLKGDHKNLRKAWEAGFAYIEENNLTPKEDQNVFQVYMTDPDETSNPANWITQIYIPVE